MRRRSLRTRRAWLLAGLVIGGGPAWAATPEEAVALDGGELEAVEHNPDAPAPTLSLGEVLDAVTAHHPALRAAGAGVDGAAGDRLAAQGAFDLELGATGKVVPVGKDVWHYADTGLRQPTTVWGTEIFGGWRQGGGEVPLYAGDKKTTDAGELVLGVALPIWQGGAIDPARAKLQQAGVKVELAELDVASTRLKLSFSAAKAYWKWVASGHKLRIVQFLLDTAEARNSQIEARVKGGDLAPIELIENQRAILKRRSQQIKARQALAEAALRLSIFLRDDEGRPVVPPPGAVPTHFPDPEPDPAIPLDEDQAAARDQQPTLRKLAAYRAVIAVDRDLADNQLAPRIDLTVAGIQPLTSDPDDPYRKTEVEAGLKFKLPLQRRKAQGARDRADADLARIDHDLTLARQQLDAMVAEARVSLAAATERVDNAHAELSVAGQVEAAEKLRMELGDTTLLMVNLREQARADAANRLVDALADHHVAFATYLTATTRGLSREAWTPAPAAAPAPGPPPAPPAPAAP